MELTGTPTETPQRLDQYGNVAMTDERHEYLDSRYSQVMNICQFAELFTQVVTIERFVTLINGNQIIPPNPLVDITVLFHVITPLQEEPSYHYTSLYVFLQENYFFNSYLENFMTIAAKNNSSETERILIQLFLRFVPPEVFKDNCSKLMFDNVGMIRAYENIYTGHFALTLMTPQFRDKFLDFCKFFRFKPIQSLHDPDCQSIMKVERYWENLGVPALDQVIYVFMMPAFLKHPQILEAASILQNAGEQQYPYFLQMHKVLDLTVRGFGFYDPIKGFGPTYWKAKELNSKASYGQTLLIYYKPIDSDISSNSASLLQSLILFGIHKSMRNGENNVTILDKDFFRRKTRKDSEVSTGYFIDYMQLHILQLLNHMSFEDAHFQAYLVTNSHKNFDILAVESDNVTIEKLAAFVNKTMKKFQEDKEHSFYYTMYSFRNFHYKDLEGESKLNQYINQLSALALAKERTPDLTNKLSSEYPYPGMDPRIVVDQSLIYAPPRKPFDLTPDDEYEAADVVSDELLGEGEETPVTFTKDKLVAKLCQSMVEICYDFVKENFQKNLVITHEQTRPR